MHLRSEPIPVNSRIPHYSARVRVSGCYVRIERGEAAMLKIRVVIAEGRTLFRQGLAALLRAETDFEIVGEAADAEEARRVCARVQPQLIVLNSEMAGGSGQNPRNVLPHLRVACPGAALVFLGERSRIPSEEAQVLSAERR